MTMLFIIASLEVLLAVIALAELGLEISLAAFGVIVLLYLCLLYTSPSPRD